MKKQTESKCVECGIEHAGMNVIQKKDGAVTVCHKCLSKHENVITPLRKYVTLSIERELWTKFKKICNDNDFGYSNTVTELVRAWVSDYEQEHEQE